MHGKTEILMFTSSYDFIILTTNCWPGLQCTKCTWFSEQNNNSSYSTTSWLQFSKTIFSKRKFIQLQFNLLSQLLEFSMTWRVKKRQWKTLIKISYAAMFQDNVHCKGKDVFLCIICALNKHMLGNRQTWFTAKVRTQFL